MLHLGQYVFRGGETPAKTAAAGAAGGVSSELGGGKFGHGFLSAGVGFWTGLKFGGSPNFGKFMGSAIVGGTLSEVTGGKFANGAAMAGFAYAVAVGTAGLDKKQSTIDSQRSGSTHNLLRACNSGSTDACTQLSSINQRDLGTAIKYIRAQYPEILTPFENSLPSISFDVSLDYWLARSGSTAFLSGDVTLSGGYNSVAELTGTVAHELLHSGDGVWGRMETNFQDNFLPTASPLNVGLRHAKIFAIGNEIMWSYP